MLSVVDQTLPLTVETVTETEGSIATRKCHVTTDQAQNALVALSSAGQTAFPQAPAVFALDILSSFIYMLPIVLFDTVRL